MGLTLLFGRLCAKGTPRGGWGGYTPGTAAIIERRGFTQYTRKVVRTRAKSALELS
jgi:hypothetical protein